jgi:hypothetical protein
VSQRGGAVAAPPRVARLPLALAGAFFASGFAGLMHQVAWSKLLVQLIGATAYAQAIVLAVFMGGLALGASLAGRIADRSGRALELYVILELAIALYCAALPWLADGAAFLYVRPARALFDSPGATLLLRLALALALVLAPAVAMGATLPVSGTRRHRAHRGHTTPRRPSLCSEQRRRSARRGHRGLRRAAYLRRAGHLVVRVRAQRRGGAGGAATLARAPRHADARRREKSTCRVRAAQTKPRQKRVEPVAPTRWSATASRLRAADRAGALGLCGHGLRGAVRSSDRAVVRVVGLLLHADVDGVHHRHRARQRSRIGSTVRIRFAGSERAS